MTESGMAAYRSVFDLRGVRSLIAVSFLARLPASAGPITLTLHVVITLGLGYGPAGLVGAASTVGMAIGAPLMGRLIDRRGLRTMVVCTTVAGAAFWTAAPFLPYPALLVCAFLGGLLGLPVYSVMRQSLAALVPPARRRPAFAVDSMSVEVSYMIGPAVGAVLVLNASSRSAMWLVGIGFVAAGVVLWRLNPPTRAAATEAMPPPTRAREWFGLPLVGALLGTTAAVLMLYGAELSIIAGLQTSGQAWAIAVVTGFWAFMSLAGGFLYGAARRTPSLFVLVAAMGTTTLLVALAGPWWSYLVLLIPAGLLCAPSLAASAEAVSVLAPEHARGVVTGLHGSAITIGATIATPATGLLIDVASPPVAVLVVGSAGIVAAGVAALLSHRGRLAAQLVSSSAASQPS